MAEIQKGKPLYVALKILREVEVGVEDPMGRTVTSLLPLDSDPGCVGMLRVFTSQEEAFKYAEAIIKVHPEDDVDDLN
jgi:hypothetical protein